MKVLFSGRGAPEDEQVLYQCITASLEPVLIEKTVFTRCCSQVCERVHIRALAVQSGSDVSGDGLGWFTINVDSDSCITLV